MPVGGRKFRKTKERKKRLKYNITPRCSASDCDEKVSVQVGTAGPANLSQRMGRSKCQKTKERKEKLEGKGKMRTLFDVGMKKLKAKDETDSTTAGPA